MPERFTYRDMMLELEKMARSKSTWLDRFSFGKNRRPDHELETKRRELRVLEQAAGDYRTAVERQEKAA